MTNEEMDKGFQELAGFLQKSMHKLIEIRDRKKINCYKCGDTGWQVCCNDDSATTENPFCSCGEHAGECDCKAKKEIVIDKLGKYKQINGGIAEIKQLNENYGRYAHLGINGDGDLNGWDNNGHHCNSLSEGKCGYDLIEFISPPEFTEEGLYEMANGEIKEIIFNEDKNYPAFKFTDAKSKLGLWDSFGNKPESMSHTEKRDLKLIRYLGKKPFEIDKPGVYEDECSNKVLITREKDDKWFGVCLEKDSRLSVERWDKSGLWNDETKIPSRHDIKKFISSTYDFSKGE